MPPQNPDFSYGIIYRIRSKNCPGVYIGSTTQRMSERFRAHIVEYNAHIKGKSRTHTASSDILVWGDCTVELIESFPCESRKDLVRREGYWIRQEECCVNNKIAGRTRDEFAVAEKEKRKQKRDAKKLLG